MSFLTSNVKLVCCKKEEVKMNFFVDFLVTNSSRSKERIAI